MTEKGKLWVFHEEAEAQYGGEGVIRRVLAYDDGMMIVENTFETGAVAALHSHPHLQTAYIAEGVFTFEIDGVGKIVKKGDSVLLPCNIPHAVSCHEAGVVLDIFTPMREDFV